MLPQSIRSNKNVQLPLPLQGRRHHPFMNITEHNKKIRAMRRKGELPPFGMTTHTVAMAKLKQDRADKLIKKALEIKEKQEQSKAHLSENGSVLPNKFACWPYPFDEVTEKDE